MENKHMDEMFNSAKNRDPSTMFFETDDDLLNRPVYPAKKEASNKNYKNSEVKNQTGSLDFVPEYAIHRDPNLSAESQMEDVSILTEKFTNRKDRGLFILCDGHGGDKVAEYVGEKLPPALNFQLFGEGERDVKRAFIEAFSKVDRDISTFSFAKNTGSTCTCLYFYTGEDILGNKKSYLVVANVGDSKAILLNNKGYETLTEEHTCQVKSEIKRVITNGGSIFEEKINGEVKLTRGFGNFAIKSHGIIVKPAYSYRSISFGDSYLILASRGVWEFVTEFEAVSIAEKGNGCLDIAETIGAKAKIRGSNKNITVIVIRIN